MSNDLPEYYQTLASSTDQRTDDQRNASTAEPRPYYADAFHCTLPHDGWTDRSTHTLTGPTHDGLTHRISITTIPDVEASDASALAQRERGRLTDQLDGCRVLIDDSISLDGGHPAHRLIYLWHPDAHRTLYQEHVYVIHKTTGYVLLAGCTPKTRKTIGPKIERMMRSFRPVAPEDEA